MTSEQLKVRLDETRTKAATGAREALLKEFGFDKAEDGKAAFATLKKLQQDQMTEAEKTAARIKELEPFETQATTLAKQLEEDVNERIAALPEDQRKAIEATAKTVQAKRDALRLLSMVTTGAPAPAAGGTTPAPPAGGTVPTPVSTQTPANPPPASGEASAWDKLQELEKTDPVAASIFAQSQQAAIAASRPADA